MLDSLTNTLSMPEAENFEPAKQKGKKGSAYKNKCVC